MQCPVPTPETDQDLGRRSPPGTSTRREIGPPPGDRGDRKPPGRIGTSEPGTSLRDGELVAGIAEGREEHLRELHRRYAGLLMAIARRILGRHEDAEDLVQDVVLQVWRQAGRYDPARASVSTWLTMLTRSRAIDRLRTRKVGLRALEQISDLRVFPTRSTAMGPAAVLERERRRRLRNALAQLPAEQRRMLEYAYYRGWSQSEIAEQTGIPLGTVKTRTLLAMRKLRAALESEICGLL
jgi:RNA polymerase sigma-70 factor (ECF subfamily)